MDIVYLCVVHEAHDTACIVDTVAFPTRAEAEHHKDQLLNGDFPEAYKRFRPFDCYVVDAYETPDGYVW